VRERVSGYAATSHVRAITASNASAVPVGDATPGGNLGTPQDTSQIGEVGPARLTCSRWSITATACSRSD
jgi:hypothetical protein